MKLSHIFWAALLLLVSSTALAAGASAQEAESAISKIFNVCTDLGEFGDLIYGMLGDVSCESSSDNLTVLSDALSYTNILALGLGVIIVYYVIIGGAVNTAQSGEVLGKNWSSVWLPVRTAIAFGLLMPSGAFGGFGSVAQSMLLSISFMGINGANFLWDETVDRITEGRPFVVQTSYSNIDMGLAGDQMEMLVCAEMVYSHQLMRENQDQYLLRYKTAGSDSFTEVKSGLIDFSFASLPEVDVIEFGSMPGDSAVCGRHTFPIADIEGEDDYKVRARKLGSAAAQKVVMQTYDQLRVPAYVIAQEPGAKVGSMTAPGGMEAVEALKQTYEDKENPVDKIAETYLDIVRHHSSKLVSEINKSVTSDSQIQSSWSDSMKKGGALSAGMWFYEMQRFSTLSQEISMDAAGSTSTSNPTCGFLRRKMNDSDTACLVLDQISSHMETSRFIAKRSIELNREDPADDEELNTILSASEECSADECAKYDILDKISKRASQAILNTMTMVGSGLTTGIEGNTGVTNDGQISNPFATLTAQGHALIATGGTIFGILAGANAIAVGAGDSVLGLGGAGAAKGVMQILGPAVFSMIGLLMGTGFVMAYVIPFMPLLVWIKKILHYCKTFIEAMIAAPLAVIQMATPEGEGISGTRMERVLQLVARLFLQPVLMVIGLLASISIAFVMFNVMNKMFWTSVGMHTGFGLFEILATMVIYCTFSFMVVKLSMNVIESLSEDVMNWFSAGVGGAFGQDATDMAQSSMTQLEGKMGGSMQSATKLIGEKRRAEMYKRNRQDDK